MKDDKAEMMMEYLRKQNRSADRRGALHIALLASLVCIALYQAVFNWYENQTMTTQKQETLNCTACDNYVQAGFKDWSEFRWDPIAKKNKSREPSRQYRLIPRCRAAREAAKQGIVLHPSRIGVCKTHFIPR